MCNFIIECIDFLFVSKAPGENNDHGNGEHEKLNESFYLNLDRKVLRQFE